MQPLLPAHLAVGHLRGDLAFHRNIWLFVEDIHFWLSGLGSRAGGSHLPLALSPQAQVPPESLLQEQSPLFCRGKGCHLAEQGTRAAVSGPAVPSGNCACSQPVLHPHAAWYALLRGCFLSSYVLPALREENLGHKWQSPAARKRLGRDSLGWPSASTWYPQYSASPWYPLVSLPHLSRGKRRGM